MMGSVPFQEETPESCHFLSLPGSAMWEQSKDVSVSKSGREFSPGWHPDLSVQTPEPRENVFLSFKQPSLQGFVMAASAGRSMGVEEEGRIKIGLQVSALGNWRERWWFQHVKERSQKFPTNYLNPGGGGGNKRIRPLSSNGPNQIQGQDRRV